MQRLVWIALGGLALATACATTLDELAPFPCADDATCPDGFTCVGGTGCKAGLPLDAACTTGSRCATGDCVGGICVPHCVRDADPVCAPGRRCSYPSPGEDLAGAYCVLDCSSAPCPDGLSCHGMYGEAKGCVPPAATASLDKTCVKVEDCLTRYGLTFLPITCARGTCAPFCSTTPLVACADPKRSCHKDADPLLSGCLQTCEGACAEGLTCAPAADPEPAMCIVAAPQ